MGSAKMMSSRHERFVVGFEGTSVPAALRDFCRRGLPAGVVLFSRNLDSPSQLRELMRELRSLWPLGGPPPLVAVDQEGGSVQRLRPPVIPDVPPVPAARALGRGADPAATRAVGEDVGKHLARYGFNLDFAPVLDVDTNPDNPIIGERAFAATAEGVIAHGLAFAQGLRDAGILPCGKHFPGHGDTVLDSHLALPVLPHSETRLRQVELVPFAAAVRHGLECLMTAHIVFPAWDAELPATLSPRLLPSLLRGEWGYDSVVFSDDLEMKAVADLDDADGIARGCVQATVDVLLVCRDLDYASALADGVGRHATPAQGATARRRINALRSAAADHAQHLGQAG